MRKLSLIAANIFIAATVLFTSCKTEDEISGPSVNFIASDENAEYVTSSASVAPGGSFQVKLNVQKGDKDMEMLEVYVDKGFGIPDNGISFSELESSDIDGAEVTLRGSDQNSFNTIVNITVPETDETLTYSFTVTDKDDVVTTKTVTIDVAVPAELTEYSAKLLGAQGASEGSYFSSSTGEVYTGSEFAANKSVIDITYAQTGPLGFITDKIISSAAREGEGLTTGTGGLEVYYQESDISYYEATVEDIQDIDFAAGQVIDIEIGDVIEFITENGSKGLIIVNDITNPDDDEFNGVLDISVKVLK